MKKIKKYALFLFCALPVILVSLIIWLFGAAGTNKAYAYPVDPYAFEFEKYSVTYDVRADRTMDVTLDIAVHYSGYDSTGIMYDIPVNSGDRVRKLKAYELDDWNGEQKWLDYSVKNEESNLITVDMGDHTNKTNETHIYRVKYEYAITKAKDNEINTLFLNAVGYGSNGEINDVTITVNLPDGFIAQGTKCVTGERGTGGVSVNDFSINGNSVTLNMDYLPPREGVTFTFNFKDGVLGFKPDLTPYWIIIAGCVLLAVLFAVKFLVFNKDGLTPVVNVEAPDDMDPLVMGKLIDNRVDRSDVTSLIFYWANKGYIKINLEDENDIELIRIARSLPSDAPRHQKIMYTSLFNSGDCVKINSLTNSFYTTVEAVTKSVNAENGKLYDGKSMSVAVLFALIGALFMGLTPILSAMFTISRKLIMIAPIFIILPVFVIFALSQAVKYNSLKLKSGTKILMYVGIIALSALFVLFYVLFTPSYVIEVVPKILIGVVGFAIVILSSIMMSRTDAYVQKLNKIIGFRQFIMYAEKDKLETMLEGNPEFYYQVLPYAIVLGVSDIWEDKFKALTVVPPSWTTRSYGDRMFDFLVFNSVMRNVNSRMTSTFVSRPSSGSFSGGGSHGGSFGGFSGGGHGGGGFRGR